MTAWTDLDLMMGDIARHVRETGDNVASADPKWEGTSFSNSPSITRFIAYNARIGVRPDSPEWTITGPRLLEGIAAIEKENVARGAILRESFKTDVGRRQIAWHLTMTSKLGSKALSRFNREDPI